MAFTASPGFDLIDADATLIAPRGRRIGLVRSVHDTGDAVVVLHGGESAAVLIGATEFPALREHRRFLAAIGEGLADVNAGRLLPTQDLKKSFEAEFGPIAWQ